MFFSKIRILSTTIFLTLFAVFTFLFKELFVKLRMFDLFCRDLFLQCSFKENYVVDLNGISFALNFLFSCRDVPGGQL